MKFPDLLQEICHQVNLTGVPSEIRLGKDLHILTRNLKSGNFLGDLKEINGIPIVLDESLPADEFKLTPSFK
jgi:hypothetical protein